jgi:phenylalanyl-tRNA synthetase beta chain
VAVFNRSVAGTLVGQGFVECVTYTLRAARELPPWSSEAARGGLALANPFVEDQSHLRPSLIPGLVESLRLNQARGNAVSRLFETGRVFLAHEGQTWECAAVGFLLVEDDETPTWHRREPADFYTTKRLVETMAGLAGFDAARQPLARAARDTTGWQAGHHAQAGDLRWGRRERGRERIGMRSVAFVAAPATPMQY